MLDKTGTITAGKPALTDMHPLNGFDETTLLALVAAAEQDSEHPLGTAIVNAARQRGLSLPPVTRFSTITGKGCGPPSTATRYWLALHGCSPTRA